LVWAIVNESWVSLFFCIYLCLHKNRHLESRQKLQSVLRSIIQWWWMHPSSQ
jgi:hypothetical protein